jgi:adenylate kinase
VIPGVKLVILGRQGAGKGTQAVRLSRHYVVPHISTGDLFRAAAAAGTDVGVRAKEIMDAGELLPDDVVIKVVEERLSADDTRHRGFLLDGFPRTIKQAEALEKMIAPEPLDAVVDLEVPTELVIERLAGRAQCATCHTTYTADQPAAKEGVCDSCGGPVVVRTDDTAPAIARRLELYEQQTAPLLGWYEPRGLLVRVDAVGPPEEVTDRIIGAVDARRAATASG